MEDINEKIEDFNVIKIREFQETNDMNVAAMVIEKNIGLIHSIVSRYIHDESLYEDAIQEASFRLIDAMREYDFDKGIKFSTYAGFYIKGAAIITLIDRYKAFGYGRSALRKFFVLKGIDDDHLGKNVVLTDEQLAELTHYNIKTVKHYRAFFDGIVSLDTNLSEDNKGEIFSLSDTLYDDKASRFDSQSVNRILLIKYYKKIRYLLDERQYRVMALRYGLNNQDAMTCQQVASVMGISKQRVNQIEHKAMNILRYELRGK